MPHRIEVMLKKNGSHRTQEGEVLQGCESKQTAMETKAEIYMGDPSFPLDIIQEGEPCKGAPERLEFTKDKVCR